MSPPGGIPLLGPGVLTLTAWTALTWISRQTLTVPLPLVFGALALTWLGFVWACHQLSRPTPWPFIFAWALLFRLVTWNAVPIYEDDYFRYLWDGLRFWQDGTPYGSPPAQWFGDPSLPAPWQEILDHINYPSLPTIYGPACQILFALSAAIAPGSLLAFKIILGTTELAAWLLLALRLSSSSPARAVNADDPPTRRFLLLISWCPLLIFEGSLQGHVDLAGFAAMLAAWASHQQSRAMALGLSLALAVGIKLFALLLIPFLLWRQPLRAWVALGAGLFLLYGFFWLRGGQTEWTALLVMSSSWEFNSWLFPLLDTLFGDHARMAALLITVTAGVWFGLRYTQNRLTLALALQLTWAVFLIVSPVINPWYLIWFLPWAALQPNPPVWTAMAVVSLAYLTGLTLGEPTQGLFAQPGWARVLQPVLIALAFLWMAWQRKLRRN